MSNIDYNDEPKYRKKSTAKGQPRSKHKHIYETVLLTTFFECPDIDTGKMIRRPSSVPTKVCTICGRIGAVDWDDSYYVKTEVKNIKYFAYSRELSEKALSLPKWHAKDYFDKFAVKD